MNIPVINSANLPAASNHVGAFVFSSNIGRLLFSNGTHWKKINFDGNL